MGRRHTDLDRIKKMYHQSKGTRQQHEQQMTSLHRFTNFVIYATMVVVIIRAGKALRNLQKANQVTQQMQQSLADDVTKPPVVQKALRVQGPADNIEGDNISQSLNTGGSARPWRVLVTGSKQVHKPVVVENQACVKNGWGGCGETAMWIQSTPNAAATSVTFAVLIHLNKDDLVTVSGHLRSNCTQMSLVQERAPSGWQGVGQSLASAVPVGANIVDRMSAQSATAISSRSMTRSFTLATGFHVIGFQVNIPEGQRPAFWFQGSVSGTLVDNILFH